MMVSCSPSPANSTAASSALPRLLSLDCSPPSALPRLLSLDCSPSSAPPPALSVLSYVLSGLNILTKFPITVPRPEQEHQGRHQRICVHHPGYPHPSL